VKVLLDTHALLWFLFGDQRLSDPGKAIIADIQNVALVSTATLWEIAVKVNLGKLELEGSYEEFLLRSLYEEECTLLPISLDALTTLARLPLHHRDPFDRLLIAQAIAENVPIMTRDVAFSDYPVDIIW
jgi:PIN domain nuclease of toxin-antitoxin system